MSDDESNTDLLDELEFRRGRTVRSVSRARDVPITENRFVRATSVLPASLRHFESLAEEGNDLSDTLGYNEGLHRARRALSEARVIAHGIRASSMERERSSFESTEKIRMKSSAMEASSIQMDAQQQSGNYKITITPRAESWIPSYSNLWSSRSVTRALLEKYNPREFPDFIFGEWSGAGQNLKEPVSSSLKYYGSALADDYGLESSTRSRSVAAQDYGSSSLASAKNAFESSRSKSRARSTYDDYGREETAAMQFYNFLTHAYGLDNASRRKIAERNLAPLDSTDRTVKAYLDKYSQEYSLDSSAYTKDTTGLYDSSRSRSTARTGAYEDFGLGRAQSTSRSVYDATSQELDSSVIGRNRFERSKSTAYDKINNAASASGTYYDAMAKAYGVDLGNSGFKRGASKSAGFERESVARSTTFEPDEAAKAYLDKYGVNLEEKSNKYYEEEDESSYLKSRAASSQRFFPKLAVSVAGRRRH